MGDRSTTREERNIKKLLEMFVEAEIKLHVIYIAEEKIDLYCPTTNPSVHSFALWSIPFIFSNFTVEAGKRNFSSLFHEHDKLNCLLDLEVKQRITKIGTEASFSWQSISNDTLGVQGWSEKYVTLNLHAKKIKTKSFKT